jgi:hypothetical protein
MRMPLHSSLFLFSFRGICLRAVSRRIWPLCALLLLTAAALAGPALSAQTANRIAQAVDTSKVQALPNHHPQWANSGNSAGLVPADQLLDHMTLLLARSPQQEQAFEQLLSGQQNPASPDYHHWLTPAEVGERFGLSDQDIATITGWLQSQGLHVNWISPSRVFIGFGGTAANIARAFQTELGYYNVNGVRRISVSSDPLIPQALLPAIKAIRGLYTPDERPAHHAAVVESASPQLTSSSGAHFIAPADFATIYDLPPSLTGAGFTIGIVGWSRVNTADFDNFRQKTGASFPNPTQVVPLAYGGVDPGAAYTAPPSGSVDLGAQEEATLDVLRAGSTAPGANLLLVVSSATSQNNDGIGADAQYLVNTSPVAQVMNISFGGCESENGASGVDYWDALFKTAALEGISVFVSSGDSGASGCDTAFSTPPSTPKANSPNYICSSSYATCVGGTEFADTASPSAYWNSSNGAGLASVRSYIPEGGWNESWNGATSTVAASGGGVSAVIPTPSWQTGTGVPAARTGRYTPDVSFSAAGHDGYFACFAEITGRSCVASNGSYGFVDFSGTSAAAPGMAGVAALLDQKLGIAQGNLNPGLYATAASFPAAFHDVTAASSGVGACDINTPSMCNNSIPGHSGLSGGQAGFPVGAGYDEVTGLGSLDIQNFIDNYIAKLVPTVTVTPSPSGITTVQALTVTVAVSGASGNPTPTGSVTLTSGSYSSAATTLLSGGATFHIPAGSLATGPDVLTVNYTPDASSSATYTTASGSSSVTVSLVVPAVTVTLSSSSITTAQALTVTVGVSGGTGNPAPTGTVSLDGGGYGGSATLAGGSATFHISAGMLTAGNDTLSAVYTPDTPGYATYNSASGSNSVTVTATAKTTPTVTVTTSSQITAKAEPLPVTITVSGGTGNPTPTGSVTLTGGSYTSAATTLNGGSAAITIPAGSLTIGADLLTAVYAPDAASSPTFNNTSGSAVVSVLNPVKSIPAVTVTPSSSGITTAQALSVMISVSGTNGYPTTTGSVTLTGGGYTSAATALAGNSATIVIPAGSLAVGTDMLTASYTPDAASSAIFFSASGTASVSVTTPVPPAFTVSGTAVSVAPGATTGNTSAITVTPSGGFTGSVTLTAQLTSSPSGAQYPPTWSFGATSPVNITSAGAGTAALTVSTTAGSSSCTAANQSRHGAPWYAGSGAVLACILLFGIPTRRRNWRTVLGLLALLVALTGSVLACGGGSSGSVCNNVVTAGTTAGSYTITVTGTSGSTVATYQVSLTVQ